MEPVLRLFPRLALIAAALGGSACVAVPKGRIAVDKVQFEGNDELPSKQLRKRMATRETQRFLGLRGLFYEYELFNRHVLERIAALMNQPVEIVAQATTANAERLFGLARAS